MIQRWAPAEAPEVPIEVRGTANYFSWLLRTAPTPEAHAALREKAMPDLTKAVELNPTLAPEGERVAPPAPGPQRPVAPPFRPPTLFPRRRRCSMARCAMYCCVRKRRISRSAGSGRSEWRRARRSKSLRIRS